MTHTTRSARFAAALVASAGLAATAVAPAPADSPVPVAKASGSSGVKGLSEAELRAWEQRVFGSRHAAEHARGRTLAKRPGEKARVAREAKRQRTRAKSSVEGLPPSVAGRWNGIFDIRGTMAINAALLPTGKVLWWAYPSEPGSAPKRNESWGVVWDPAKGTGAESMRRVDPPIDPRTGLPANIWCSGVSFLADGRVLATGGNLEYYANEQNHYKGLNQVYTFNPFDETWTRQPDMARGRWYPSQVLMPDGRTLIIQGQDETGAGTKNTDVEVFTPSPDMNGVGTITKHGQLPVIGEFYPHTFWMPSARILIAGPFIEDSWYFTGVGADNYAWADIPNQKRRRAWGTAVLEPAGPGGSTRVLQAGGSDNSGANYNNAPATNTAEVIDDANPAAGWQDAPGMNVGRSHHNMVNLPDGTMVTVGGGVGTSPVNGQWTGGPEHRQVELWNPQTKTWSLGPSQLETRAYHSTALLLPDGRVLSAGDDRNGGFDRDSAEFYEPPYLHRGPRPTITRAPSGVDWNTPFDVATPNGDVTRAALVAPAANTHATDFNQRYIPLTVTRKPGGVTLQSPPNANVAPPGYYMLFLLDSQGVPSVAQWVNLRSGPVAGPVALVAPAQNRSTTGATTKSGSGSSSATARARARIRVRAAIVRRKGQRVVRVTLARSSKFRRVKVRIVLGDRRRKAVRVGVRTVRTGRTTYLSKPRVTGRVRTVRIRVL